MSRPNRRLPEDYIEGLLPTIDSLISRPREEQREGQKPKMRKVHFYIDNDDYQKLEQLVAKLSQRQEVLADARGLASKILRAAVKLGLREIEERLAPG